MYRTCLYCQGDLGRNEAVERFPVGHRLAFDPARGRLWVVCPACCRWNLSPIEDRWEAVEECERLFRGASRRVSTGEISLARLRPALDLIRIGEPLRPEFAGWRYGGQLRARRRAALRRKAATVAGGIGVGAAVTILGGLTLSAFGIVSLTAMTLAHGAARSYMRTQGTRWREELRERTLGRFHSDEGRPVLLQGFDADRARIIASPGPDHWALSLTRPEDPVELTGPDAYRALGLLAVVTNDEGGSWDEVQCAADAIDDAGGPAGYVRRCIGWNRWARQGYSALPDLAPVTRLALEMAAHEDFERAAMELDLKLLRHAWREAEALAAIADSLLLPAGVEEFLARHHLGGLTP